MTGQGSIKLVCFDLGGVLVRIVRDWAEVLHRASIDPGRCNMDLDSAQIDPDCAFELGRMTEDEFIETHRRANPLLDREQIQAVIRHWLVGMYDGAGELLAQLQSRPVTTTCLSNTNAAHWQVMQTDPVFADLAQLNRQFASHLLGCRKPDADAYECVERQTGFQPQEMLFFDDSESNCGAARLRGWQAYLIDPHTDPIGQVRCHLGDHGVL